MSTLTENIVVGLVALALVPVIGWRIWRGVKDGSVPLYRTRFRREEGKAKFNVLLALHAIAMLLIAVVAADLLLGLGLKERLL
jgi:hypothetical protein